MNVGAHVAVAAAAHAAAVNAQKSFGTIVTLDPQEFLNLLAREEDFLVVHAVHAGFFSTKYKYLTSYKGLAFFCQASEPIDLPDGIDLMQAESIAVPE